jgi:uncharacterized protein (TIGR02678 family)
MSGGTSSRRQSVADPASVLDDHLASERSVAARSLLANPLLDADNDPDAFRSVVRHALWLTEFFEQTCGWVLTVDAASGFARLAKRAVEVDVTRPLRRTRGEEAAFDRRRYQLLCLVCAELVRHPVTTVGLLASAMAGATGLDTGRYGERAAFVDALRALRSWGALKVIGGEVDAFLDSQQANAILSADTTRLHRLLVSPTAPSSLAGELDFDAALERMLEEPRYGPIGETDPGQASDETRNRWARHRLGRRLLDDPAVHFDDLSQTERDYAASMSGRRWLRERAAEAGFDLEERSEGLLAVDHDGIATDIRFPAPLGHVYQLALLLADRLTTTGPDGRRQLGRLEPDQLRAEVDAVFARFPGWARGQREEGGPQRLAREAVELLVSFGLAHREPDGTVIARPAIARYRVTNPVVSGPPSLFEEEM